LPAGIAVQGIAPSPPVSLEASPPGSPPLLLPLLPPLLPPLLEDESAPPVPASGELLPLLLPQP
jgi:hypothetical protein